MVTPKPGEEMSAVDVGRSWVTDLGLVKSVLWALVVEGEKVEIWTKFCVGILSETKKSARKHNG